MTLNLSYDPNDDDLEKAAETLDGIEPEIDPPNSEGQTNNGPDFSSAIDVCKEITGILCDILGVDHLSDEEAAKLIVVGYKLNQEFPFPVINIGPKAAVILSSAIVLHGIGSPRFKQMKKNKEASIQSEENVKANSDETPDEEKTVRYTPDGKIYEGGNDE